MTWPKCVAYVCVVCKEHTINEVEEPCVNARECPDCYALPDLDQAPEDHILPSLRWAANSVVPINGASAGLPEAAPLTWGVDPEAGAAPPTEGRGTSGGAVESGNPFFGTGAGDD